MTLSITLLLILAVHLTKVVIVLCDPDGQTKFQGIFKQEVLKDVGRHTRELSLLAELSACARGSLEAAPAERVSGACLVFVVATEGGECAWRGGAMPAPGAVYSAGSGPGMRGHTGRAMVETPEDMARARAGRRAATTLILLQAAVADTEAVEQAVDAVEVHPAWTAQAPCVVAVLLTDSARPHAVAAAVLQALWNHNVQNAVVLILSEDVSYGSSVVAYTWGRRRANSGRCGPPELPPPPVLLDTCKAFSSSNSAYQLSFPSKSSGIRKWNSNKLLDVPGSVSSPPPSGPLGGPRGCLIVVSTLPWPPYVMQPSDGSKTHYTRGIEIEMILTVMKATNYTVRFLPPHPLKWMGIATDAIFGISDVALGGLIMDEGASGPADMSPAYNVERLSWFVPCGAPVPRWRSLLLVFQPGLIAAAVAAFVIVVIALWSLARWRAPWRVLMVMVGVMVGVAAPSLPRRSPMRHVFAAWALCSLVLAAAFQCFLVSFLADPGMQAPLQTLAAALRYMAKIYLMEGLHRNIRNFDDEDYRHVLRIYENCSDQDWCLRRVARERDAVLLATRTYSQQRIAERESRAGRPLACALLDVSLYPVAAYLTLGSPLLGVLHRHVPRAQQAGLFEAWRRRASVSASTEAMGDAAKAVGVFPLAASHLQGSFIFWTLGMALATLAFMLELVVARRSHRRTTQLQRTRGLPQTHVQITSLYPRD